MKKYNIELLQTKSYQVIVNAENLDDVLEITRQKVERKEFDSVSDYGITFGDIREIKEDEVI
jgi:ribosome-binding protein aMBF1 (putative translation factor)